MPPRILNRAVRWWRGRRVGVWYDPAYRLPLAGAEVSHGMEPRRADFVAWYLLDRRILPKEAFHLPTPASWHDLERVHTTDYLETLSQPETLARIFASTPNEIPVDELMRMVRLAVGGTIAAARWTLETSRPAVNLLGGFHHAGPAHGGGFCPVNDIAVALEAVRAEGFRGSVVVLDLDAHPPDGTAACLRNDPRVWLASMSGSDWGTLDGVDEVLLPPKTGDAEYLAGLDRLLARMPRPDLAFVLAGGDVLASDRFGALSLTLDGARRRDLRVAEALDGVPSVWLPAGGYTHDAWRVFAGAVLAVTLRTRRPIATHYDPLAARYDRIATKLRSQDLGHGDELDDQDLERALGLRRGAQQRLFLDYYSTEGIEYALHRYGLLDHLARLGYEQLRVVTDHGELGERMRVLGTTAGVEQLLIEVVLEKQRIDDFDMLYIHWLTLRHPRATFEAGRPRLPGQDVPGLGLAREAGEMLSIVAKRLSLAGVAFRPAWFHMAYAARPQFRFVNAARQGRFEALVRDLAHLPLREATLAIAEGRVHMNGEPYTWEAAPMAFFLHPHDVDRDAVAEERGRVRFEVNAPSIAAHPA